MPQRYKKKYKFFLPIILIMLLCLFGLSACGIVVETENQDANISVHEEAENPSEREVESENSSAQEDAENSSAIEYKFRNQKLKNDHFEKHGKDMGFADADAYEAAASDVANSKNALHKIEAEDGDDIYYIEETNEFVVVSTDGYLRTYFNPDRGKAYFDKQ